MRSDDMRARFFTATAKFYGALKTLALLSASTAILPAQPVQQVHANPDCQFFFTLSTASSLPTGSGFDNRQQGCTTWAMSYVNSGFTGLTVTLQSAPNNAGSAGTFAAGFPVQQTSISGSNAITDTTGGFWWVQGTNAFVRVNLSGLSGSGVVNGAVYGWRIPNAGGGTNGAIVCLTGDVSAGSGSGCLTATVQGIEGVPFCSGYSPSNGDFVQYTTGGSPNPCYTAAAGGSSGGLVLLEEHTASNSSALNFTSWYSASYDEYEIELVSVQTVSSTSLLMQMSTNGGSSYDSGTNYSYSLYVNQSNNAAGHNGATGYTAIWLRDSSSDVSGNWPISGSYKMFNPAGSANKVFLGQLQSAGASDNPPSLFVIASAYISASAVNAFRVIAGSGNLASGTVRVYGLAK